MPKKYENSRGPNVRTDSRSDLLFGSHSWVSGLGLQSSKRLQRSRANVGRDRVVPGVQRRAEGGETGDGDYRNERSDEAVLDRRRAGLITKELLKEGAHCWVSVTGLGEACVRSCSAKRNEKACFVGIFI